MNDLEQLRRDLIGTYRLVSTQYETEGGEVGDLFGSDPVGYMTYSEEGYMTVVMARADRPPITGGDILDGTDAERAQAFASASAFVGRFELVEGGQIRYELVVATYPNWVGTTQERQLELDGDELVLTTPVMLMARERRSARVVLRRVEPAGGISPKF